MINIVHAGRLLAKGGHAVSHQQSIIVDNGRIVSVEDGFISPEAFTDGREARVIDLSKHFVLPGLIDAHTHIAGEYSCHLALDRVTQEEADVTLIEFANARKTLLAGFTTIRDLGFGGTASIALRNAINKGLVEGPRILTSIELISPTGGHGDFHDGFRQDVKQLLRPKSLCDGPDACRRIVRELVGRGADVIKFAATGGTLTNVATGKGLQFFDDEMKAIVDTAHMLGRPVAVHAHGTDGILAALQAGVDTVEHGTHLDARTIEMMKNSDAYLVPTLVAAVTVSRMAAEGRLPDAVRVKAQGHMAARQASVRRAFDEGVRIGFGSDAAVIAHGRNAEEFVELVEAGVPAADTLAQATINSARMLGLDQEIGSIEPGKAADIIAVAGDPIQDITALRSVAFVMRNGTAYKSPN